MSSPPPEGTPTRVLIPGGPTVNLGRADFVGKGGEGVVYRRGDLAYKIYLDPGRALPLGKIQALGAVDHPGVVRPIAPLLAADGGALVGYTMRFVDQAIPLCAFLPRAFRDRHGLGPSDALELVAQLRSIVEAAHAAGALIVDLHELNFLLTLADQRLHAIDVDSWQAGGFPATALMDSVRDRQAPPDTFDTGTDWFAFAITSFQVLRGIHPYRGRHPRVRGLDERMRANLSVLHPDVRVPAAALPEGVVPGAWNDWYRAVFEGRLRAPPPPLDRSLGGASIARPAQAADLAELDETVLAAYEAPVRLWASGPGGRTVALTDRQVWLDGRPVGVGASAAGAALAFTSRGDPVLAQLEGRVLRLRELSRGVELPLSLEVDELTTAGTNLIARCADALLEIELLPVGPGLMASPRLLGTVLPHATKLFPGVALQSLLGATWASLFPTAGTCLQVRLPALDPYRIVEARFESGVLMVVGALGGRYDRLVLRFDEAGAHDLRIAADVELQGLNFAVLDTGVCVCLSDAERLEVFPAAPGSPALRRVESPSLGDAILRAHGAHLIALRGPRVCRISLRAP